MIAAALKLLAPYLIGAFVVLALGTGSTVWYLKHKADKAEKALAEKELVVQELASRVAAANKSLETEKKNSQLASVEYKRQIKEMEDDIAKRNESIAITTNDLNEANALVTKLLKDGDDETKRFLGPLPPAIIDILRRPAIDMPGQTNGDANHRKAAPGLPFTGYAGANIDSD